MEMFDRSYDLRRRWSRVACMAYISIKILFDTHVLTLNWKFLSGLKDSIPAILNVVLVQCTKINVK